MHLVYIFLYDDWVTNVCFTSMIRHFFFWKKKEKNRQRWTKFWEWKNSGSDKDTATLFFPFILLLFFVNKSAFINGDIDATSWNCVVRAVVSLSLCKCFFLFLFEVHYLNWFGAQFILKTTTKSKIPSDIHSPSGRH